MRLIFDCEANGLLDTVTRAHCIATIDIDTEEEHLFPPDQLAQGLDRLSQADLLIAHNGIGYDSPLLKKLYNFSTDTVLDTILLSKLNYPDLFTSDCMAKNKPPKKLYGSHSLEAWGYRLGIHKGEFGKTTDWDEYTDEMGEYCLLDCKVTLALYRHLDKYQYSIRAIELEHRFAEIIADQMTNGIRLDVPKTQQMDVKLSVAIDKKRSDILQIIPVHTTSKKFTPKRDNAKKGYKKGIEITKYKEVPFNPGSRNQIIKYFKDKYQWEPTEFTDKGNPAIGEDVLSKMPYTEAKVFSELFILQKIKGFVSATPNSWLNIQRDGRLHGQVDTVGTRTRRCTHYKPSLGTIPARGEWGEQCRSLFIADEGEVLVGADLASLEVRCMAHYMADYDGGRYAEIVLNGDVHEENRISLGIAERSMAKRWIFAMCYGSGGVLLGEIIDPKATPAQQKMIGNDSKRKFFSNVPALKRLIDDVTNAYKRRGYIYTIDRGKIVPKADYTSFNALLQSTGSIIAKQALINFWEIDRPGVKQVIHLHDEQMVTCPADIAEQISTDMVLGMERTTEQFNLNIQMSGDAKIGQSWREVH